MTIVGLALALVPSIIMFTWFRARDRHPEPGRLLARIFILGVLVAIPIVVVELLVQSRVDGIGDVYVRSALTGFVVAGLIEEVFKFGVLRHAEKQPAFDEPMDGIVYGAVASLGFATIENVLYVADGGLGAAIVRGLTAVPSHAADGAIMGYFVGRAHIATTGAWRLRLTGLLAAILLHGLYDTPLFIAEADETKSAAVLIVLLVLVVQLVWSRRVVKRTRRDQDGGAWAFTEAARG